MDARRQLNELITAASLPPVESTRELAGGFDNQLLVGVLRDGRSVLLRQCPEPASNPGPRARFLAVHEVGAPRLYAADDTGAVLVEFVPGETLAAVAGRGELGDREWHLVGRGVSTDPCCAIPDRASRGLRPRPPGADPTDPVDLLNAKVDAAEPAIRVERPGLMPLLDVLRERINARGALPPRRARSPRGTCLPQRDL